MSVSVEKLEKGMAKLTIEVEADKLDKAIDNAYRRNRSRINVPGFRRGKAPRKLIEKMYGPEIFYEEAANELINDEYPNALDECEETIVSNPTFEVVQIESGSPFIFTAEVALRPEVHLGKYKGIEVSAMETDVTDEEVDAAMEQELNNNARIVDVTDREVRDGDDVILDFEGFVDDKAFEGGKAEGHRLTIGSGQFIPGFEDALIGAKIDEPCDVNVTFPDEYHEKSLAGKPALFKCVVKGIKEHVRPELDDDFASDVSEFETVAEWKEDMKKKLVERKEADEKIRREGECVEALIADSDMELPEAMIETQQRAMVNDMARQMQYMNGIPFEQYLQMTGNTPDTMMDQARPRAIENIKARLVLEEVATVENLYPDDEAFDERLKEQADKYGMELSKLKDTMSNFEKKRMRQDMGVEKAAEFLIENAKESKKKTEERKKKLAEAEEAAAKGAEETKRKSRVPRRKKKESDDE